MWNHLQQPKLQVGVMNQADLVVYEFLPTVNLIRSGFITASTELQFFIKEDLVSKTRKWS